MNSILKSWKTTASGFALAILNLTANGVSIKHILISAAFAALGTFAKDHNVSSPPEPQPAPTQTVSK